MKNDAGDYMELYIPRKCSASHRIISAKEHGSIQINICQIDASGQATSKVTTIALSQQIRRSGDADAQLNELVKKAGIQCCAV